MHVAVIMDGNGRWAKKRGLPRIFGHRAGADRIDEIVRACPSLGVKSLTLFAFSTENWQRPRQEVKFLMELLTEKIKSKTPQMQREGVRLRFLGDRTVFSKKMQNLMTESEAETAKGQKVNLSLCLNYGSQNEIVRAVRNICQDVYEGKLQIAEITEDLFASYLDTRQLPPPDLIIRTSGEQRISNFLLYQSAYAECYFTQTLWPDFNAEEFAGAVEDFKQRQRRFGKVK